MQKCKEWSLKLLYGTSDICLMVNGKQISELFSGTNNEIKSSIVSCIINDEKDRVKVTVDGDVEVPLSCKKLVPFDVLGWHICDKETILEFWGLVNGEYRHETFEESAVILERTDLDSTNEITEDGSSLEQKSLFESIKSKSVGKHYLDISNLKSPPSYFKVRERNDYFVDTIAERMIQKRDISIDHASNIIACIDIDKSNFKEEMLQHVPIYVIDGNHNIKAQTIAFERTNDWIFKYRMVHVYCNLSPEEALILGTSRNEDSSTVLKFTDFEKVDLIHRYLYTSAKKNLSDEPPEPHKGFTTIYKQLLNLKTKKEVDARAIIRLLATKLSSRNYGLFSSICKNTNIKASRFECLRGLDEEQMFRTLSILEKSGRTRNDWKRFRESSLTHKKDFKKRSTVQISFNHMNSKADITTNERKILQDCVCFAFTSGDGRIVQTLSSTELESLVFAAKTDTQTHRRQDTSDVSILEDVSVESDVESRSNDLDVESRGDDSDVESRSSNHSVIPDTPRKTPKRGLNVEIKRSENTRRQDSLYPVTSKKDGNANSDVEKARFAFVASCMDTPYAIAPRKRSHDEKSEYSGNSSPSVTPQKGKRNAYSFTSDEAVDEASPLKSLKEACGRRGKFPVCDYSGSKNAASTREEDLPNCKVRLTDIGTVKDIRTYICKPGKTEK